MDQKQRISEITVQAEFNKSTEKFQNIACWIGIVLNIVWFVGDYLGIPEYWIPFLEFRLAVSLISMIVLLSKKQLKFNINHCLFILVFGISIQNAYMWSVMDIPHLQKHAFAYTVLFIGVGMLVLWETKLSWILLLCTIIANIIFYKINSPLTVDEFITNGALLTFTVAIFSVFLIRTRVRLSMNELRSRLELSQSNNLLELEHKQVVLQKAKITESINYSYRIQSAILPTEEIIKPYFTDALMIYEPKDIVSGDFPWMYVKDDVLFLAVVDCTGHGVPGALLSIIGHFILNEHVTKTDYLNAALLLDGLHHGVKKTLKQHENKDTRDGMDVAMCMFDLKNNTLDFAGAHRHMYLVRDNEITEIKGTKRPIGGTQYKDHEGFINNKMELRKGDTIYFYSDGMPDQVGGTEGKKFFNSKVKELIQENNLLEIATQKSNFLEAFNNYKGNYKQVDDVLFLAIRI